MRILAAFALSRADLAISLESEAWELDIKAILRQHNIRRCMHGVPPLRWSLDLADESAKWANKTSLTKHHGFINKHAGQFKTLGQNLALWTTPVTPDSSLSQLENGALPAWHPQSQIQAWIDGCDDCCSSHHSQLTADPLPPCSEFSIINEGAYAVHCKDSDAGVCFDPNPRGSDHYLPSTCLSQITTQCPEGQYKCTFGNPTPHPTPAPSTCDEYSQMVWKSTTHIGCAGIRWYAEEGGHKTVTAASLVCDYGKGGNVKGQYDKEVLELKKSLKQCTSEIDSPFYHPQPLPPPAPVPRKVTIEYTPPGAPVPCFDCASDAQSQQMQSGKVCMIEKYKLAYHKIEEDLVLVGLDSNDKPCAKKHYDKSDVQYTWQDAGSGFFTLEKGPKSCLMTDPSRILRTYPGDQGACTSGNDFLGDQWRFNQDGVGTNLCMKEVPDANKGHKVVHNLQVLFDEDCSSPPSLWRSVIQGHLQSALPQQNTTAKPLTCKDCLGSSRAGVGNFACLSQKKDQCLLSPNSIECTAQGGTWCAKKIDPSKMMCAGGDDDWAGSNSKRRECSAGCSWDICEQKKHANPRTAIDHCYTKDQLTDDSAPGIPHGCNYGSAENTCAYDGKGQCVYSRLGSTGVVAV